MLASLKSPGITKIKAKKSRNHTELLFKSLKIRELRILNFQGNVKDKEKLY